MKLHTDHFLLWQVFHLVATKVNATFLRHLVCLRLIYFFRRTWYGKIKKSNIPVSFSREKYKIYTELYFTLGCHGSDDCTKMHLSCRNQPTSNWHCGDNSDGGSVKVSTVMTNTHWTGLRKQERHYMILGGQLYIYEFICGYIC